MGSIELRDYNQKMKSPLIKGMDSKKSSSNIGFYSPQPIRNRKPEQLITSTLKQKDLSDETSSEWAEIYMMDVYNGLEDSVKRGSIKKLAIVQEMEKPKKSELNRRAFSFQFPVVSAGATYAPKRV